jgi:hypothetical protein
MGLDELSTNRIHRKNDKIHQRNNSIVELSKSSLGKFKLDVLFKNETQKDNMNNLHAKLNSPYISDDNRARMNNICYNMKPASRKTQQSCKKNSLDSGNCNKL